MTIEVTTSIPFGNAADVEVGSEDGTPTVRFRPHPHGGPVCLWFCFRVRQVQSKSIRLVLKNPINLLGGSGPQNFRPVIRTTEGTWKRIEVGEIREFADGRSEVAWTVRETGPTFDFAFCYPYGMDDVQRLVHEADGYWTADPIGVSQAGRPLVRLSNGPGKVGSDRPGFCLISRQHSGETPGSWVLDGILRHIAALGDEAPLVWAIPLANIDGVEQGDYGKDNFPIDLNRAWGQPPMRHETLVYQRDIKRWAERCKPLWMADFHAPGGHENEGVYTFIPDPDTFPDAHKVSKNWADAIDRSLGPDYASKEFARIVSYKSRWELPNYIAHACDTFSCAAFSFETPYSMIGKTVLTPERYREIGARIAEAAVQQAADDQVPPKGERCGNRFEIQPGNTRAP